MGTRAAGRHGAREVAELTSYPPVGDKEVEMTLERKGTSTKSEVDS